MQPKDENVVNHFTHRIELSMSKIESNFDGEENSLKASLLKLRQSDLQDPDMHAGMRDDDLDRIDLRSKPALFSQSPLGAQENIVQTNKGSYINDINPQERANQCDTQEISGGINQSRSNMVKNPQSRQSTFTSQNDNLNLFTQSFASEMPVTV